MSKLLIDEQPLLVLPKLAGKIGLNEAIILQQIHYWIGISEKANKNFEDGYYWIYNSFTDWEEQFPFWGRSTIKRTITSLEKQELLVVGNYNRRKMDRTKWYRIDYKVLQNLDSSPLGQNEPMHEVKMTPPLGQNEPMHWVKMTPPLGQNGPTLPETTTETTTEITTENSSGSSEQPNIGSADINPFVFYQQNLGVLSPFISESIGVWCEDLNDELVIEAMKIALKAGKGFDYGEGCLKKWKRNNITTLNQANTFGRTVQKQKKKRANEDINWEAL